MEESIPKMSKLNAIINPIKMELDKDHYKNKRHQVRCLFSYFTFITFSSNHSSFNIVLLTVFHQPTVL